MSNANTSITIGILLVAAAIYFLIRSRRVFVIKIRYRSVKLVSGSPPPAFMKECKEVTRIHKLIKGKIFGVKAGNGIKLEFSRSMSQPHQQIFRNVFPDASTDGNSPPDSSNGKRATF